MSEILGAIKLKDRIIIISLMVLFAVLLAIGIGAVTEATVDVHKHTYEYRLERGEDGDFDYVGVCTDKACEDPRYVQNVLSGVNEEVTSEPTCCQPGNTRYTLYYQGNVYTLDEEIPKLPHEYEGFVNTEEGVSSVHAFCTNEGCTSPELKVENTTDIKLEELVEATCHSPRYEKYTYTVNGEKVTIESTIEEKIPHTLNGVSVSEIQIEDGIFAYGTKGLTLIGVESLSCGQQANATYVCEECSKEQRVLVVRPSHNFVYQEDETVLPTENKIGSVVVKCSAEDCGITSNVILPKIILDENAVVIIQDQDKESQTVKYTYHDNQYGFTVEAEIVIPWINHLFAFTDEDVVRPTLDADGSVTLKCQNSVCSEERVITLPKMVEEGNTTVTYHHLLEKKTYTYLYENTEYDFEITFSYDTSWVNHTYKYVESETVKPDLLSEGVAYVRCDYEGCDKYHEISLPKIVIDENAFEISPATEQVAKLYGYAYHNDEYNFTVTVEFSVGKPLTHDYKYRLDINFLTGKFDFVGTCNQLGCQTPEVREENVEVQIEDHSATCTTDGYLIITYVRDGEPYTLEMPNGTRTGHNFVASDKVDPTFVNDGSVILVCSNEGCGVESELLVLPKFDFETNTKIISDVTELSAAVARYTYTNEEYDYVLTFEFTIGSPLPHDYNYQIIPNEETGGYDLVGECKQPGCQTPSIHEKNIDVVIEERIFDCTTDGYIYVKYEKDGVLCELTIPTQAKTGHKFDVETPISKKAPTWENEGNVVIKCINEGCEHTHTVVLPIIKIGETAFNLDDNQLYYIYTDKETGYEHFFLL